jgi:hypothetical protein
MKKHIAIYVLLWICAALLVLVAMTVSLVGQERDTVWNTRTVIVQCPCDSAFVRYARFRFERNTDQTILIMNALKDHAQAYYVLQHRVDSLREVLHKHSFSPPKKRKK